LEANQAVSFFIKFAKFRDYASVRSMTLENCQTREKLVIKLKTQGPDYLSISRCPMETNVEVWIKEMRKRPNLENRTIEFGPNLE
jgi:hypothetical protein